MLTQFVELQPRTPVKPRIKERLYVAAAKVITAASDRTALGLAPGGSASSEYPFSTGDWRQRRSDMTGTSLAGTPFHIINKVIDDCLHGGYPSAVSVAFYYADSDPQELTIAKGIVNRELNLPASPDVIFELGSVTKVFTSTLLGFDPDLLDQPLRKHLPIQASNPNLEQVTLKMLGTHTSGFPRDVPHKSGPGADGGLYLFHDEEPPADSALVHLWENWTPREKDNYCSACTPGTCWQYSNVGFVTLGYAVAKNAYNSLLREKVTGPLKMNSTGAQIPDSALLALGYPKTGETEYPCGQLQDLKSSGNDMLTWIKANLGVISMPKPLSDAIVVTHKTWFEASQQCRQPHVPPIHFDMGLAWQKSFLRNSSFLMWAKDGGGNCSSCWIGFIPEKQIGVAVLTNGSHADQTPTDLGISILQQVLHVPLTLR
jgi:CubicO group peptidase (beta-lactamase class C family)